MSLAPYKEKFCSLEQLNRTHITTEEAAFYLNRRPHTLRSWACSEKGLLKPVRVSGRLAWKVDDIKKLLGE